MTLYSNILLCPLLRTLEDCPFGALRFPPPPFHLSMSVKVTFFFSFFFFFDSIQMVYQISADTLLLLSCHPRGRILLHTHPHPPTPTQTPTHPHTHTQTHTSTWHTHPPTHPPPHTHNHPPTHTHTHILLHSRGLHRRQENTPHTPTSHNITHRGAGGGGGSAVPSIPSPAGGVVTSINTLAHTHTHTRAGRTGEPLGVHGAAGGGWGGGGTREVLEGSAGSKIPSKVLLFFFT